MIELIKIENIVCAIIIRHEFKIDGIKFFTEPEDTMQIGYMNRLSGYSIFPHIHKPVTRTVEFTNEVLLIKTGKVKVNFYDDEFKYSSSVVLNSGDVILLKCNGHGFEMLEDTEIIEIKQGPYAGENDKIRFQNFNI